MQQTIITSDYISQPIKYTLRPEENGFVVQKPFLPFFLQNSIFYFFSIKHELLEAILKQAEMAG